MSSPRVLVTATAACLAILLAGCGAGDGDAAAADASSAEASAEEAGYDDIPTTDELETKMAEEVTEANADEEFEKLRQELEAEEDG
ncbi:MAG: hypothetical protein ACYTG2_12505 [Planctomycetota bacterium]|jgi:hypothetical protein